MTQAYDVSELPELVRFLKDLSDDLKGAQESLSLIANVLQGQAQQTKLTNDGNGASHLRHRVKINRFCVPEHALRDEMSFLAFYRACRSEDESLPMWLETDSFNVVIDQHVRADKQAHWARQILEYARGVKGENDA